ncbi:hypothetical protein GCK72_000793 [Caenorhabditis remanei]|uniref:F-box domain-containing protein n=1 Tax=Caenorhabditis remanei TaxID=31234 RepID=A0A6A5HLA9_CAERE|nr:hypothetical protein GCK72_000793 [Caenorhabditis remanei]KAF1768980.1 hypothetical protein GCK72_000793 [Caenorhabditis remanei]
MPLPILKLPFLPIQQVLQNLDTLTLFDFSTCSRKCRRVVSCIRHKYTGIKIGWNGAESYALIKLETSYGTSYSWKIAEICAGELYERRKIGNMTIMIRRQYNQMYTGGGPLIEKLKEMYKYLIDLFHIPILNFFGYYGAGIQIPVFPANLEIKKCDEVVVMSHEPIDDDQMKYILGEMITKKLNLHLPNYSNFPWESTRFSMDCLNLQLDSKWVSREMFLSLKYPKIYMKGFTSLTSKDVRDFINQWFNSNDTRLETLLVDLKFDEEPEPIDLSEFNPKPWDPILRGQYYDKNRAGKLFGGMDIIRKDGRFATFRQSSRSIDFFVWKNTLQVENN